MDFLKLVVASIVGRVVSTLLGIVLFIGLLLVIGVFNGGSTNSTGLDKSGVSVPESVQTTTSEPTATQSTTSSYVGGPDEKTDYTSEERDNVINKAHEKNLTMGKSDDDLWKMAEEACHNGYTGVLGYNVTSDTKDFQKLAVHELCPQYNINIDSY